MPSLNLSKASPEQAVDRLSGNMLDITADTNAVVETDIRSDGKVLWVNVNGICVLRICRISQLVLTDRR